MFVDSVYVFPKFRKQFVHIFILGLFDMIKDISEPTLRVLTFPPLLRVTPSINREETARDMIATHLMDD